jgi:plasmid stabilization system protein ParE
MAEIRITRRALSDLNKIEEDSISDFDPIVADKYIDDIEDALKTLSEYPGLLREKPFADHVRFFGVRKHTLVFCMLEDILYLLTLKYGGMDIEDIIMRLEPTLLREAEIMHERLKKLSH